jgi:hypothetical protein
MKRTLLVIVLISLGLTVRAQNNIPAAAIQIQTAELAAPADKRGATTVYGYSAKGEFILLRKGTNEMICLADDPKIPGLNVACYHQDLEPFMKRGRDLKVKAKRQRKWLTSVIMKQKAVGFQCQNNRQAYLFIPQKLKTILL